MTRTRRDVWRPIIIGAVLNFATSVQTKLIVGWVYRPPYGVARCRKLIAIAIASVDRDPVVCDRHVDPTLEIAIADAAKVIALKRAARRYTVAHKNSEDLASDFIVGGSVRHEEPAIERQRQVWLYQFALAGTATKFAPRKLSPLSGRGMSAYGP